MSRDPAFLFYDGDAARDVSHMNRLERGAYFDIIQMQRKCHGIAKDKIGKVLGKDFDACWPSLEIVLSNDESGYFIPWVRESIEKRARHCEKQRENANQRWHKSDLPTQCHGNTMGMPLEDENEIEIETVTEDATEVPKDNKELGTISPLISEVIEYFNDKLGTRYTTKSRQINGFISGREKDGYGLADFKKVIDGRITAWKNDPKMSEFLRPSTLFSPTNFEQYLNAPVANNPLSLAADQEKLNARKAAQNAQG